MSGSTSLGGLLYIAKCDGRQQYSFHLNIPRHYIGLKVLYLEQVQAGVGDREEIAHKLEEKDNKEQCMDFQVVQAGKEDCNKEVDTGTYCVVLGSVKP